MYARGSKRRLIHSIDNPNGAFGDFPDVIFADGGITQIRATKQAIKELGLSIPVYGMVKMISIAQEHL